METPWQIDVLTAVHRLQAGALLLDVREPDELACCALAGATHIPMRDIPGALGQLPPDRDILVLCHHGGRSLHVTRFLRANGFARATNVAGGIDAWAEQVDPTLTRY
ncbi:MAG: rhodanese-like domain-containing protein [Opitutales bacterium]